MGDSSGAAINPLVSSGTTNQAEAVGIDNDPRRLSRILTLFCSAAHDCSPLDRQGDEHERHCRPKIFYADDKWRRIAQV
jgi:peptide methionine sulfoxide reductase MsrA